MKFPRRKIIQLAAAAAAAILVILCGHVAWSQGSRLIKIIVPASPGGGADTAERVLGEQIGKAQGQTALIENRPGAGGVIAAEAVSHATPDGNTVLWASADLLIRPHLRKLNYDILTSFGPICYLVSVPTVIVVNETSPYRTLADLVNAARLKPGDLTLGSFGPLSVFQIGVEMLRRAAKVDITFVPFPGGTPALNALLGEHVTSVFETYPTLKEQLNAGKLRPLATGSRTRIETLAGVPTVAESGYKEYNVDEWFGVAATTTIPIVFVTAGDPVASGLSGMRSDREDIGNRRTDHRRKSEMQAAAGSVQMS
jgi:tripartite-type tricarboxylate transporter receptor subunit TctC